MKFVKMMTVIDGRPTPIGKCHPGQARLLQKKGIAKWKDGKLWFEAPTQSRDVERILGAQDEVVEPRPGPTNTTIKWTGISNDLRRIENEIDPEGLLRSNRPSPEYIPCSSLGEWFQRLTDLKKAGHELGVLDNPVSLHIGFIDVDTNTVFELSLNLLRTATQEDYQVMGDPSKVREWMKTPVGRARMIGDEFMGLMADPTQEVPKDLWKSPPRITDLTSTGSNLTPILPPYQIGATFNGRRTVMSYGS